MKRKHIFSKSKNLIRRVYEKCFATICLFAVTQTSVADEIIPISSDDQVSSNSDFAQTIVTIIRKDLLPIIMLVGAAWLIWTGISTMSNGVKEAQDKQKFDPLKSVF